MKEKQFACLVLGMAICACFFGIMKMRTKLQDTRKRAESAKTTAENTQRQQIVANSNFTDLQAKSRAKIEYYNQWRPHFEEFPSAQAVTDVFLAHMKRNEVEPFSQSMAPVAYKDKHGVIAQVQRVGLTCVGEYDRIFNWLGAIEKDVKTCRVTSCDVSKASGDAEVRMVLTIDVPLLESAGADEAKLASTES